MMQMNLENGLIKSCATLGIFLPLATCISAKPAPPSAIAPTPSIRWRVVKAETYTFTDEWNNNRVMRGVKVWISSPGYVPTINAVIPDDTDQPAHWQLADEQGNTYVKDSIGIEYLDYAKHATKATHVLEFTGLYTPIPYAKIGQIRLRFPIEFRKINDPKDAVVGTFQCDTVVTHHK